MGNRLPFTLALAVLIGTSPAAADVTAQYVNDEGRPSLTVEVDDRGNVRVGGVAAYYLRTPDGEYLVEAAPGGPKVTSLEAAVILAAPELRNRQLWRHDWHYEPAGTDIVGAWEGRIYNAAGPNLPPRPPTVVVSHDPRLAAIGRAMLQASRAEAAAARRPEYNDPLDVLLARGALLQQYRQRLDKVSFEPVAPARFALPAPAIETTDLGGLRPAEDAVGPVPPRLVEAAFAQGELWTRDERGGLWLTAEGSTERTRADVPGDALALCRGPTGLWLATSDAERAVVRLWRRSADSRWSLQGEVTATPDSVLLASECSGERPLLLFTDNLVVGTGERVVRLPPDAFAQRRYGVSVAVVAGALYAAVDNGEWGGGITRIDLGDGGEAEAAVAQICVQDRSRVCQGISGLAPDPARPGCLLASIATITLGPKGEVVRVCGTSAERVLRKPYTMDPDWQRNGAEAWSMNSVAFWAMATTDGAAWAAGDDGLYRFGGTGGPELQRFPPLAPNAIDWSHPSLVLVPQLEGLPARQAMHLLLVPR